MSAKGPELCMALRQGWEGNRKRQREGKKEQNSSVLLPRVLCLKRATDIVKYLVSKHVVCCLVRAEIYRTQSLFQDRNPGSGTSVIPSCQLYLRPAQDSLPGSLRRF